ncbi:MAG: porin [Rhodoferax sp.]|nr:porin [Rhodoferax sp.]
MKKSLIALAVLAASGAAMAQSSVTLYGIADIWFGSVKNENNAASVAALSGAGSISQTLLNSGGVNGSRWGLKGSEDLGGGLKANFDYQAGISLDTGAGTSATATAFSRQSWVGFSGGFGAVRLGRTTTPFDDVSGSSDAIFDSALAPMNSVFKSVGYSARQSNMIYYQAPSMGGFSGALSYGLGEDKTATTGATSTTSMNLTYGAGPLAVQFAYQVEDIINPTAASSDKKFTRLGGSYDLGVAVAKLSYGKLNNVGNLTDADATEYQIGVDYKASPALVLSASYARSSDNATAGNAVRKGFGLGASYTLSKRTFLYGGFESDTANGAVGVAKPGAGDSKHSVFAVGVQHRF